MLLVLGAGAAVFLLVLFPRLTASRAAESKPRRAVHEPTSPAATPEGEQGPATLVEPEATPVPAPTAAMESEGTPVDGGAALMVVPAPPKVEGPKLKYEKGHGKQGRVESQDLLAEQRERRKERRQASGQFAQPDAEAAVRAPAAAPTVNRELREKAAASGQGRESGPSREVGKKKKRKSKGG